MLRTEKETCNKKTETENRFAFSDNLLYYLEKQEIIIVCNCNNF